MLKIQMEDLIWASWFWAFLPRKQLLRDKVILFMMERLLEMLLRSCGKKRNMLKELVFGTLNLMPRIILN